MKVPIIEKGGADNWWFTLFIIVGLLIFFAGFLYFLNLELKLASQAIG